MEIGLAAKQVRPSHDILHKTVVLTYTVSWIGHGYSVDIASPSDSSDSVIIGPNWTRGLAVHPVGNLPSPDSYFLAY